MRACLALAAASAAFHAGLPPDAATQETRATIQTHWTGEPIRLDGSPDESAWWAADSLTDFRQFDPREGEPATERTVVRFLKDDHALYVGIWAYDRHPRGIRRSHLRRDAPLSDDDNVLLVLDPAMDRRSAVMLAVNANGALWDAEMAGSGEPNEYWNGVWDGRAAVNGDGWTAELIIPFQMLRIPGAADRMGLNVGRFLRRKNEWVVWRAWRRQHGILFLDEAGVIEGLAPLPARRALEVRPYAAVRHESGQEAAQADAPLDGDVGLDAKVAPAPTLTLDLTVNTDFAQADVDALVVNLSRFPVFFPEQREFFLEAAPLFDFGAPSSVKGFHSRRIGLDSAGAPVPIVAGARLTGRVGAHRIGLLGVRTGAPDHAFDVVGRARRDVFSRGSVGGLVTLQTGPGVAGTPTTAGFDFRFPLLVRDRNVEPSGYLATTFGRPDRPAGVAWRVAVEYPNDLARHGVAVGRIGAGFDPSLGFVRQTGVWELLGALRFYPRPGRWGIRRLLISAVEAEVRTGDDWRVDNAIVSVRPLGAEFESGDWGENRKDICERICIKRLYKRCGKTSCDKKTGNRFKYL